VIKHSTNGWIWNWIKYFIIITSHDSKFQTYIGQDPHTFQTTPWGSYPIQQHFSLI